MNINFKSFGLEDKDFIQPFLDEFNSRSCDFTFTNLFLWSVHYKVTYAVILDTLVMKSSFDEKNPTFTFPAGKGDVREVIGILQELCREQGTAFTMHSVSAEQIDMLNLWFPGQFTCKWSRDTAEYIYETEKLITLAGKKYHGKRNHIRRFKDNHPDWSYESIHIENKAECLLMAQEWRVQNGCEEDEEKHAEFCVTLRSLTFMEELGLKGGLLRADGKVIAISVGEPANDDTFVVHIEKSFGDIQGAYPLINQQFAEHEAKGYLYINREDDVGSEGLRKAKLSYGPAFLLEKAYVTFE